MMKNYKGNSSRLGRQDHCLKDNQSPLTPTLSATWSNILRLRISFTMEMPRFVVRIGWEGALCCIHHHFDIISGLLEWKIIFSECGRAAVNLCLPWIWNSWTLSSWNCKKWTVIPSSNFHNVNTHTLKAAYPLRSTQEGNPLKTQVFKISRLTSIVWPKRLQTKKDC